MGVPFYMFTVLNAMLGIFYIFSSNECYVQYRMSMMTMTMMIVIVYPGRKFVSILMRFWYLTSARLPDDSLEGTRIFQVAIGGEGEEESESETKRLLTANYE